MVAENKINTLPEGWIWTTIGEIGIVASGGTPSTQNPKFWGGDISWITPADLSNYKDVYIDKGARSITKVGLEYSSAKLLPKGSILFSSRAPIGYVVIAKNEMATNQGFKNIILTESLLSEYVYYYLKTIKPLAENMASGTTFLELSATKFTLLPFPLPPLHEQRRIVSKIEELLSELDHAEAGLKKAQNQLAVYRQALLKSAFEGKLTEKWRKTNSGFDSYSQLEKIQKEREKGESIIKKTNSDFSFKYSNLVSSWVIANLNDLIEINARIGWRGLTKDEYTKAGPLFLSVHSLNYGKTVVFNDANHISVERYEESPEIKLKKDDILLCKDGAGIGKVGIIKHLPEKATVNSSILVIRAGDVFVPDFLYYLFSGPLMQKLVFSKISGSAIPHLFQKDIKQFNLHVPPIEEQHQIVQELEYRFTLIENLEKSIKEGLQRTEIYRQSILKKAFEGNLVNQNLNDEPAKVLLERILKEKKNYLDKSVQNSAPKNKAMKKRTLSEILNENFVGKVFSFDELRNKTFLSYEELKNELYHLLDEEKSLETVFNENLQKIQFKLKS